MAPANDHVLSLKLTQGNSFGDDFLQLNRPSFSGLNVLIVTNFSTERPVHLFCTGIDNEGTVDIITALRAGLLELVEQSTQRAVSLPAIVTAVQLGRKEIPPRPSPEHYQSRISLQTDSTAQLWKDVLQPGKTYVLRLTADGRQAWCCYSNDDDDDDAEKRLPVHRDVSSTIQFTVFDDPAPPTLSAKLSVSSSVCHLSGTPPFKFIIDLRLPPPPPAPSSSFSSFSSSSSSDHHPPLTLCTQHTPFGAQLPFSGGPTSLSNLITCIDTTTAATAIEFPSTFECFDCDPWPAFPPDSAFVELRPGGDAWRFAIELAGPSATGADGGLEYLEAGRRYEVELARQAREGFGMWVWGEKEEVLRGTVEEREERWRSGEGGRGRVAVVQESGGRVGFDVVE